MSLNIFTKIPEDKEFIVDNEQYFFDNTINCIDAMASDLLRIDSAMYCNT